MHCPLYNQFGELQLVQFEAPRPLHVAQVLSHSVHKNVALIDIYVIKNMNLNT